MLVNFPWGGEPDLTAVSRLSENFKSSPKMLQSVRLTNDVGVKRDAHHQGLSA